MRHTRPWRGMGRRHRGGASALAGHAARVVLEPPARPTRRPSRWPVALLGSVTAEARRHPPTPLPRDSSTRTRPRKDAMFGSLAYALLGRGVRTALPSDVSHPALSRVVPCPPTARVSRHRRAAKDPRGLASQRRVPSLRISVRSRHRRPHAAQQDGVRERGGGGAGGHVEGSPLEFLRMVPKQRFYPQCRKCSDAQSVAVRAGKKMLVQHGGQ